ncbi:MAG: glycosyltransferase family 39 protein [Acidobacteriota bacterium]|nr:glycosyltransferase family 39 protein [Acidobacteriota bacterium]
MRRAFCAAALLALACLLPRAARVGLAGGYVDPVGRITARDEALYSNSAIAMAERGDWLTPHFMGRPALSPPPALIWASALSARWFGITRFTLRLPVALIAALAVGLVFLWGAESASITAGICAALLVLSNHLFQTLAALCMTDALLAAFTSAAVYAIFADPWLESRAAFWGFASATAAAILTKGIAGIFPLAVLGVYAVAARRQERPAPRRALLAGGVSLALAAPWFLYQLAAHPLWFYGAGAPPQASHESAPAFYLVRLAATDPILTAAVLVAAPGLLRLLRRREAGPTLLAIWLVLGAATLGGQYPNAAYLLPMVPALALIGACYGAFAEPRHAKWMLCFVLLGVAIKAALPDAPYGLSYRGGSVQPLAPALADYCDQDRRRGLIVVDFADDLYAAALPLYERPSYAFVGPMGAGAVYGMPFEEMGIVVTVPQYGVLASLAPGFRARLRDGGVGSGEPVATLIHAASPEELGQLVRVSPLDDFLIPERYRAAIGRSGHVEAPAAPGYFFLLSPARPGGYRQRSRTCHM